MALPQKQDGCGQGSDRRERNHYGVKSTTEPTEPSDLDGAQLPDYNAAETIDHVDECLVPYDFHWTQDSAITDDDSLQYYSALPYGAKFFAIHRTEAAYEKAPRDRPGPYMPVVFTACEEGSYAYEYHHGAIGHGVFTYALAKEFRKAQQARETGVSFKACAVASTPP